MKILENSEVTLHFSLKKSTGEVIEDSRHYPEPARLIMGQDDLPLHFEKHLLGLKVGDHRSFTLTPEEAFGVKDPRSVYCLPREKFAEETLEEGMVHTFAQKDGSELLGMITEIRDQQVTVDFNHPLAGQTLIFEVEILGVH